MGGARPPPLLHHSFTKLRPEGLKKFWMRPPPPPNFEKIMVLILHKELESKLERVRLV